MTVKFKTIEGPSSTAANPVYIGLVQHQAIYSKSQFYERLASALGYPKATIAAAFMALKQVINDNLGMGQISKLDDVFSFRQAVTGAFASSQGPWVKGVNMILNSGITLGTFKAALSSIIPQNATDGAKPLINSVYDETTKVYDVITGTDTISIAGSDLAVDMSATDEGVWLRNASGTETKMTVSSSDVQVVKAALSTALAAGEYTLVVRTRSGLGEEYGVSEATRKVVVATAA